MSFYIGLMSGTSMDGVDVALVEMPSNRLMAGNTKPYSHEVKNKLQQLTQVEEVSLAFVCQLNTLIGREFAAAANEMLQAVGLLASEVAAIGSHGQTVCHDALVSVPYTLQIGCPHTISSMTGVTVVADFRTRDLVNGGQGAPFAPLYHKELFGKLANHLAVVNIGGIANVSVIESTQQVTGWDVGPGNCLMDAWIARHKGLAYDAGGCWAQQGQLISELLENLLSDSFFLRSPPKSVGKEYFSLSWLEGHIKKAYRPEDVMNTLLALTAHAIANSIQNQVQPVTQLLLCGGGTHNLILRKSLMSLLPETTVQSSDSVGVSPDYLEAMMCAWLAYLTMNKIPVNLSSITGSKSAAILGAIYPTV